MAAVTALFFPACGSGPANPTTSPTVSTIETGSTATQPGRATVVALIDVRKLVVDSVRGDGRLPFAPAKPIVDPALVLSLDDVYPAGHGHDEERALLAQHGFVDGYFREWDEQGGRGVERILAFRFGSGQGALDYLSAEAALIARDPGALLESPLLATSVSYRQVVQRDRNREQQVTVTARGPLVASIFLISTQPGPAARDIQFDTVQEARRLDQALGLSTEP